MARYEATVTSPEAREDVFDFLADFRTAVEWDPGVKAARLVGGEPGTPGAEYELTARFLGRDVPLTYRAEAVDRPRRLLLVAETPTIVSRDEITLDEIADDGTSLTYVADLRLRGPLQLLDPALGPGLFQDRGPRPRGNGSPPGRPASCSGAGRGGRVNPDRPESPQRIAVVGAGVSGSGRNP